MNENEPIIRTPLRPASPAPNRGSGWDSLHAWHTRDAITAAAAARRPGPGPATEGRQQPGQGDYDRGASRPGTEVAEDVER